MAAVIRYNNRLSSNSCAVRCSYDNSGTAPDVQVHLATMHVPKSLLLTLSKRLHASS